MPSRYAAKLLAPKPIRKLGPGTMHDFLEALGVKLVAVVDEEAVAKHSGKIALHHSSRVRRLEPATPVDIEQLARELVHRQSVEQGRRGGRKRTRSMTPEARSRVASLAGLARWAGMSPRKRQRVIARLNAARLRKRQSKRS